MRQRSLAGIMERTAAPFFSRVREDMLAVEARMRSAPGETNPQIEFAINQLLSSGGKRIRPTLVLLVGGMFGATHRQLISLAAAIELLHTATLVHDDLIDGSLIRRGNPTLNSQWPPAATVLTGDYAFAHAAHLAAETGHLPLMKLFARTLMTMVNGEITQLFNIGTDDLVQDYSDRIYAKTASLFEAAAYGAAIIANCEASIAKEMRSFGYEIGMAFQIVDDVLDFTGLQEQVGKPLANDLRQGIITLPTIKFHLRNPSHSKIKTILAGEQLHPQDLETLITEIRQSQAICDAMNDAETFVRSAQSRLNPLPDCDERHHLDQLASYIMQRQY